MLKTNENITPTTNGMMVLITEKQYYDNYKFYEYDYKGPKKYFTCISIIVLC